MPSLVATTFALASTTCVRMHYVRTNCIIDYTHVKTDTTGWWNKPNMTAPINIIESTRIQFIWYDIYHA